MQQTLLELRVVTLWQPWASLMAYDLKRWETRPRTIAWRNYRGPVAVHAASSIPAGYRREAQALFAAEPFRSALAAHGIERWQQLPTGAILSIHQLVDCVPTEQIVHELSELERAFGNYEPGRLALRFTEAALLPEPIPARGYQGLWTYRF